MVKLETLPFVLPLAEWIWGTGENDDLLQGIVDGDELPLPTTTNISARLCLSQVPFLSGACFSQLITKALGVAIILGACLNKAPIMINMMNSQSAAGFSRLGMYSETLVYANGAAYGMLEGHPVTAYGENLALLLQNCILIGLIWKFTTTTQNKSDKQSSSSSSSSSEGVPLNEKLALFASATLYLILLFTMLPPHMRYLLQASNGAILIYSRGTQVWETYQIKHTGAQSIVTASLNLVGGLARIFTTLKETGDMAVVMGFALSVALNFAMFCQYWIYKQNTDKFMAELQAQQNKKKKE